MGWLKWALKCSETLIRDIYFDLLCKDTLSVTYLYHNECKNVKDSNDYIKKI